MKNKKTDSKACEFEITLLDMAMLLIVSKAKFRPEKCQKQK